MNNNLDEKNFANCMKIAVEACEHYSITLAKRLEFDLKKADRSSSDYSIKEKVCHYVKSVDPELSDKEYLALLRSDNPLDSITQIICQSTQYQKFGIEGIDIGGAIEYTARSKSFYDSSNKRIKEIDDIIDDYLDLTGADKKRS